MVAGQWLEREGRFSCSTKKKLIGRRRPSCQDRGQSDNLASISISVHKHIDAVKYCRSLQFCVADKPLYTIGQTIIVLRTPKKTMQEWNQ